MDDNQAMQRDPNAPVERNPFSDGYREGQYDLMYGLAKDHKWATDKLESFKASLDAAERDTVESAAHFASSNRPEA